jgi:hypothetical protein
MRHRPGLTLDYALLRWPDGLRNPSDSMLPGSIVVRDGRQTFSFTYVYPGGAEPRLPDTAMRAP